MKNAKLELLSKHSVFDRTMTPSMRCACYTNKQTCKVSV